MADRRSRARHLAVVTETGLVASVTESAGHIWAELARRHGPSLVLLEHYPAPEGGESREGGESLDLVRIGADGSPRWSPRLADSGGQSPSRRAGALDGRLRAPYRQQDGE
jgi:hypothetical protein